MALWYSDLSMHMDRAASSTVPLESPCMAGALLRSQLGHGSGWTLLGGLRVHLHPALRDEPLPEGGASVPPTAAVAIAVLAVVTTGPFAA